MRGPRPAMRFHERRPEYSTDTQHLVNLSAYRWAMEILEGVAHMRVLDAACGTGYGSFARARLGPRLARLERELDDVRRLDPWGLRGLLPRAFRHRIASLIRLSLTLTLLAVCRGRVHV